ncbi:hypothetical protein QYF61_007585 [Mycteria americana]|uniref:RING-type E3 ubiquitin transferase n=1 Tax=Mycteria americana TaxID=33587 RepID=A0AAN7NLG2_MYCAM|nr:hypothetical protein QYF61_007585 [Mycteria americana]
MTGHWSPPGHRAVDRNSLSVTIQPIPYPPSGPPIKSMCLHLRDKGVVRDGIKRFVQVQAPFEYWKAALRSPRSLLFSRLNNPNSQPVLIREGLQLPDHLRGPPPDPLTQVHVFLMLGAPELKAVLQMHPLGLCNSNDEEDLYEYGWVGVVKLEQPELEPKPCLTVLGKAKQPQVPQPLPISLVLQTLHQLHCPSLDLLQPLNVSLVVRGPTLNTAFEVRPHQCPVQGDDHCPSPAGHTIPDRSQDAIGFLGRLGTLLAHIQAAVNQHPQVLFCQAAFQPLFPKPVALHGVVVAQVQDLALGLVEPHTIDLGPSIQPVQVPLQSLPTLKINKLTTRAHHIDINLWMKASFLRNWPVAWLSSSSGGSRGKKLRALGASGSERHSADRNEKLAVATSACPDLQIHHAFYVLVTLLRKMI